MSINKSFGIALKQIRKCQNLTQEDFTYVSSRTYISTLERGLKSPTIEKVEQLANSLHVHPALIIVLAYTHKDETNFEELTELLRSQHMSLMENINQ